MRAGLFAFMLANPALAHAGSFWHELSGSGRDHDGGNRAASHHASPAASRGAHGASRGGMPAAPTTVGRMTDAELERNEQMIRDGVVDSSEDGCAGGCFTAPDVESSDPSSDVGGIDHSRS